MKKHRNITLLLLCLILFIQSPKAEKYCFRVYLNNKGITEKHNEPPYSFLSPDAIERRRRQNIPLDTSDIPIAHSSLNALTSIGAKILTSSKWLSTVVVESNDSLIVRKISNLNIVDSVKLVHRGDRSSLPDCPQNTDTLKPATSAIAGSLYGYARRQIEMMNGIHLHENGYKGQGMKVAVIDAGFKNVNRISAFASLKIAGVSNIVCSEESVFTTDPHGTKVLSCLAANLPGIIVGTAPEASYWLIKSEDTRSEYPIEEDYLVAALEYADSAGVNVITSSLGYYKFDDETLNYPKNTLDGQTAFITKAVNAAADKGILLIISAGNEAGEPWQNITFPADAKNILTIGAITENHERSTFSSYGLTADNRIKPDLVALGTNSTVITDNGDIAFASGTSFATPIIAGLAVCLWQALPQLTNIEIINLIRKTASNFPLQDKELGYGIPDFHKALKHQQNEHQQ
ncbi:MAG: S8 family serine peptidase [Tannerellaceae bacterium]|nr:S8 family serine peptidase [Tannerellaceae bacterium]